MTPDRPDEWRRARMRVAWELHPDRGGDPGAYLAAMAAVDRRYRPAPVLVRTRPRRRLPARLLDGLRARIPRRRRWIEL